MNNPQPIPNGKLSPAASITWAASRQTYYTIRFLTDRDLVPDAFRAYGYFRWVDDQLDQGGMERAERIVFVQRQRALIDSCYRGEWPRHQVDEETMLVDLVRSDREQHSGLQSYLRHMMAVMEFDAERRGRLISQEELSEYTRHLAMAVTEALHYFIGHGCAAPRNETRYWAATAAHVTHMLRDTLGDLPAGYINIPREYLEVHRINPGDVGSDPYRTWVQGRVRLARACFRAGKGYLARVENLRCRLAGYAYLTRFAGVLDAIERDGYRLRSTYSDCKTVSAGLRLAGSALGLAFNRRGLAGSPRALPAE